MRLPAAMLARSGWRCVLPGSTDRVSGLAPMDSRLQPKENAPRGMRFPSRIRPGLGPRERSQAPGPNPRPMPITGAWLPFAWESGGGRGGAARRRTARLQTPRLPRASAVCGHAPSANRRPSRCQRPRRREWGMGLGAAAARRGAIQRGQRPPPPSASPRETDSNREANLTRARSPFGNSPASGSSSSTRRATLEQHWTPAAGSTRPRWSRPGACAPSAPLLGSAARVQLLAVLGPPRAQPLTRARLAPTVQAGHASIAASAGTPPQEASSDTCCASLA